MVTIVSIERVRAALEHADQFGADTVDEACKAAAAALGIPVEMVQAVAYADLEDAPE